LSFPLVGCVVAPTLRNLLAQSAHPLFGFLHSQPVLFTPSAPGPRHNLQESHLSLLSQLPSSCFIPLYLLIGERSGRFGLLQDI
ncbi:hypothetical protein B0H14DRAFT_2797653, partial [Mycena olivaceomarginata]